MTYGMSKLHYFKFLGLLSGQMLSKTQSVPIALLGRSAVDDGGNVPCPVGPYVHIHVTDRYLSYLHHRAGKKIQFVEVHTFNSGTWEGKEGRPLWPKNSFVYRMNLGYRVKHCLPPLSAQIKRKEGRKKKEIHVKKEEGNEDIHFFCLI